MSKWRFSSLLGLVIVLGVLMEINHAYRLAMDISDIVLPAVRVIEFPRAMQNSPVSNLPIVHEFDGMTLISGTVMWID